MNRLVRKIWVILILGSVMLGMMLAMSHAVYALEGVPITGVVYHDQNLNGVRDTTEPGVPDVRVTVFSTKNTTLGLGQTDAQGSFTVTLSVTPSLSITNSIPVRIEFTNIDAAFALGAGMQAVWFGGAPTNEIQLALNRSSDYCPTAAPADACVTAPIRMTGRIWRDANANGVQDANEDGFDGVTVRLYDEHDALVDTQLTQPNGLYTFTSASVGNYGADGLPNTPDDETLPGLKPSNAVVSHTYTVRLDNASDFAAGGKLAGFNISQANTPSGEHSALRDSDATIVNGFPRLTFATGVAGESITAFDMGLFQSFAVGGLARLDDNHDGVRSVNELLLPNVAIELYNNNNSNTLVATSASRGNGVYRFTGLLAGRYRIRFGAPIGYTFTTPLSGPDSTSNSDAGFPLGFTAPFTLTVGKVITSIDVGLLQLPAGLSLAVAANGAATDAQGPTLLGGSAISWRYDVTNTGQVTLTKIAVLDENFSQVTCPSKELIPNATMTCTAQGQAISGIYSSRIRVNSVNSAVLAGDDTVSFSLLASYRGIAPAAIRGRIWFDANRNSQKNSDELHVPDVVVSLYRVEDGASTLLITDTANNNGDYAFGILAPGAYRLGLALPPEHGLAVSTPDPDNTINNDFDPASAQTSVFNLSEGQLLDNIDAGVWANQPHLALALYINQQDGGRQPGVLTLAENPLVYSYVVMNLGNEPVSQILVSDTVSGLIGCPKSVGLQPNQQLVCQSTVANTNSKGKNRASASALVTSNGVIRELSATDQAYYLNGTPHLVLRQSAAPIHNTPVANGTIITYVIAVTNTGTFTTSNFMLENTIAPGTSLLLESVVPSATNAATVYNSRGVVPLRWVLSTLGPDQAGQVQFSVKVSAALNGSVSAIVQDGAKVQSDDPNRQSTGNQLVHPFLPTAIGENSPPNTADEQRAEPVITTAATPIPRLDLVGVGNGLIQPGGVVVLATAPALVLVSTISAGPAVVEPLPISTAIVSSISALPISTAPVIPAPIATVGSADVTADTLVILPTGVVGDRSLFNVPVPQATVLPIQTPARRPMPWATPSVVQISPSVTPVTKAAKIYPTVLATTSTATTPAPATNTLLITGMGLWLILGLATVVFAVGLVMALWWIVS